MDACVFLFGFVVFFLFKRCDCEMICLFVCLLIVRLESMLNMNPNLKAGECAMINQSISQLLQYLSENYKSIFYIRINEQNDNINNSKNSCGEVNVSSVEEGMIQLQENRFDLET